MGGMMQKALILSGIALVILGLIWPWVGKIPLGNLPGDIVIDKPGVKIYFPITTMLIVSVVISLLLRLFK
jgi:membrane protein implicated in regulation of membrane protease activity